MSSLGRFSWSDGSGVSPRLGTRQTDGGDTALMLMQLPV